MISLTILIYLAFAAACGAINKDADVNSFVAEVDRLSAEIVQTVDAEPTVSGVGKAQKLLDARKNDLKQNYDKLKELRGFQLSQDTAKKFADAIAKDISSVGSLQIKYAEKTFDDASFGKKLSELSSDFNSIFGV